MAGRGGLIGGALSLLLMLSGGCADDPSTSATGGCASAAHNWKSKVADGLTEKGQATKEHAEAVTSEISNPGARVEARDANVYVGSGPTARVEAGQIYTVVIPVSKASDCPSSPSFRDGVPLTYEVK